MKNSKRRRRIAMVTCIMILLAFVGSVELFASGNADKAKENSEEVAKLRIWIPGSGDVTYDGAWHTILEGYKATNPKFDYELTFIPWSEYFTKLNAGFAGDLGPDFFGTGYGQLGVLQDNGNLLPLEKYVSTSWDGWTDIPEIVLTQGQKDNKTFGLLMPDIRTLI